MKDTEEVPVVGMPAAGGSDSFTEMVEAYHSRLWPVARRILSNPDDAGDALQDALLSAFVSFNAFRGASRVSTWLHRIVVNACLMSLRRTRRKPLDLLDDIRPHSSHELRSPFGYAHAEPVSQLEQRELVAAVRQCIDALPDRYRAVIVLRDLEDLDTVEAAQVLGVTPAAVKLRLFRARRALRDMLSPLVTDGAL